MGCIGSKLRSSTTRSGVEASSSAEKMKTVATKKENTEEDMISEAQSPVVKKRSSLTTKSAYSRRLRTSLCSTSSNQQNPKIGAEEVGGAQISKKRASLSAKSSHSWRSRLTFRSTTSKQSVKKFPDESAALSQKSSVLTNKSSLSCWSSEVSERSASSRAKNKAEFDQLIATEKNLIVVDFFATWCGPCKAIAPHLAKWAEEYDDVTFIKIDVDENEDTAEACGISAMPTFHFYKNGKKVDEIVGANHEKIKEKILALK